MPEYLSPGVYVEEIDSGAVPMENVGTSTAGFIGLAARGPVGGRPQLITSFADYQRTYGGFLSPAKYGGFRFLPYAVQQFFQNGGARAFVVRVVPQGAKAAVSVNPGVLSFKAKNPGEWGDRLRVSITPANKAKTQALAAIDGKTFRVKNGAGFTEGDVVELFDGKKSAYNVVKSAVDNVIMLEKPAEIDVCDKALVSQKFIRSCEMNVFVKFDDLEEGYQNVSLNELAPNYIVAKLAKSDLVSVSVNAVPEKKAGKGEGEKEDKAAAPAFATPPFAAVGGKDGALVFSFEGGSDGSVEKTDAGDFIGLDNGPGQRTGIQAFIENGEANLMAVPGVTIPEVQLALVAHCEQLKSRFAVLDIPLDRKKVGDILEYRDMFDTTYAAMYHPWVESFDMLTRKNAYFPPSGSVMGVIARTDIERGVFKAPANEVVNNCTGLSCPYNEAEQDMLNPKGVNLIRAFAGRGIRVWGARTLSSNPLWRYINVRRLFIFIEQTIKASTNWVVFEPNSEALWGRVSRTIELFLSSQWRMGALAGASPAEAFFVEIGPTTMTQDDIDSGRLICNIGIAPVKPAEFVIFRVTQHTLDASEGDEGGGDEGGEE